MKYYVYRQNNSGGQYIGPKVVIVQAENETKANGLATGIGPVYFDGVANGIDCDCCGDRWYGCYDEFDTVMAYAKAIAKDWCSGECLYISAEGKMTTS